MDKVVKTEEEWRAELSDLAYKVTRQGGTEPRPGRRIISLKKRAFFIACVVILRCLNRPRSLRVAQAGPPSPRP